jgi:hypothetical protein
VCVWRLAFGEGGDAAGACGRNDSENGSKPARTICTTNNPDGAPEFFALPICCQREAQPLSALLITDYLPHY